MIGPIKPKRGVLGQPQLVKRQSVADFVRGRDQTIFIDPRLGKVTTPSNVVIDEKEAIQLAEAVERLGIKRNFVYPLENGISVALKEIGEQSLVFSVAGRREFDAQEYILPQNEVSDFLKQMGTEGDYYFDPIDLSRPSLIRRIRFADRIAADFINNKLISGREGKNSSSMVIYHSHRDEDTGKTRFEADAIVSISTARLGLRRRNTVYLFVHRLPGTELKKIPLENLIDGYPPRVVFSQEDIKFSNSQYEGIYRGRKIESHQVPFDRLEKAWALPVNRSSLVEIRWPTSRFGQRAKNFWRTVRLDKTYGLTVLGGICHSIGKGFAEGAILYAAMGMAAERFKFLVPAMIFAPKVAILFHLRGNTQEATHTERIEDESRVHEKQNKQNPLFQIGVKYRIFAQLLKRFQRISFIYMASIATVVSLYPQIFLEVFKSLTNFAAGIVFTALYYTSEILNSKGEGAESKNAFKIAEERLRNNPEVKKKFWTNVAVQDNLPVYVNQAAMGAAFAVYSFFILMFPGASVVVGVTFGALALIFGSLRLILPLFARDEKTRMIIPGTASYLRGGKILWITDNISLKLEDEKVEVIKQKAENRIVARDFDKNNIKLMVQNLESITIKEKTFAKTQTVVVRVKETNDPTDPREVMFEIFAKSALTPQQVKERYIEIISEESANQ